MTDSHKNAVVIGAGPAGLSAALGLLRSGVEVTVIEQRPRWAGRVCGSFLNPEAAHHLWWLGLLDEVFQRGAVKVESSTVTSDPQNRSSVKTIQRGSTALGIPRKDLEEILTNAVQSQGGTIQTGARVVETKREGDKWICVTNTGIQRVSSYLVHADGRYSLSDPNTSLRTMDGWYGWNAAFQGLDQQPGDMSLHLYPGGYVGILTFNNGTTNVCGLVHRKANDPLLWDLVLENAIAKNQYFSRILKGSRRTSDFQGVGPLPFALVMRQERGAFLAGDAAAVGDPFMGEGIGRALGAGPMIAQAFSSINKKYAEPLFSTVQTYESLWRKSYSPRLRIGHWLRRFLNGPTLLPTATKLLIHNDWLMRWATNRFHVGYKASLRPTALEIYR